MPLNVTVATFPTGCNTAVAQPSLVQWDRGQILQFAGFDLPVSYQVEFSSPETVLAIPAIGSSAGVEIPNVLLQSSAPITAYLVLHEGEDDRETERWATIYVKPRQMPPITEPDPEQEDIVDQAIAALQQAVSDAEGYADDAAGSADVAEAAKDAIQDMNVAAQGAAAGTQPTVEKTVDPETGAVTLHFTLPAGADGYSPAVSITAISGGHRVTITDSEHQGGQSFDVMDGEDGVSVTGAQLNNDYTLTLTFSDGSSWTSPISIRGATGATPAFSIGTVSTGPAGSSAAASITGTPAAPVLNLTIPKGDPGEVTADVIAFKESTTTASKAYAAGDYLFYDGTLYKVTSPIASGGTIIVTGAGANVAEAVVGDELSELNSQLTVLEPAATPSDVGKALKVKTVSGGKVTEYEYGETGGAEFIVTMIPDSLDYSGSMNKTVAEIYAAFQAHQKIVFRVMTSPTTWMDTDCTARWEGGMTYPSFNAFIVNNDDNLLIFAGTGATDDGTTDTYFTEIYPLGTVECDTQMSDSSTNPVQNRVIKSYVDNASIYGMNVVKDLSSTDITLAAQAETRYIYGELASLTVSSLPSEGIVDILFTSGTTATVVSLPNTVKMPSWFSVGASMTVEISILDGVYGSVQTWAS